MHAKHCTVHSAVHSFDHLATECSADAETRQIDVELAAEEVGHVLISVSTVHNRPFRCNILIAIPSLQRMHAGITRYVDDSGKCKQVAGRFRGFISARLRSWSGI